MRYLWLALVLCAGAAWGDDPPFYTAASIVNTSNYTGGPFAPNSILSIFGTGLSRGTASQTADDIHAGALPFEMAYTRVYVDNAPAPLFYVSATQINVLMPPTESVGARKIRVAREGITGPEITVTLVDAAPALFLMSGGYAIATHANNQLITADSPAHSGEIIVIYATGLGRTAPTPAAEEIPAKPAQIVRLADLRVMLNGAAVPASRIQYAGLTPGYAGLYQINVALPDGLPADPEIRVAILDQTSPAGLKLPVAGQ